MQPNPQAVLQHGVLALQGVKIADAADAARQQMLAMPGRQCSA